MGFFHAFVEVVGVILLIGPRVFPSILAIALNSAAQKCSKAVGKSLRIHLVATREFTYTP